MPQPTADSLQLYNVPQLLPPHPVGAGVPEAGLLVASPRGGVVGPDVEAEALQAALAGPARKFLQERTCETLATGLGGRGHVENPADLALEPQSGPRNGSVGPLGHKEQFVPATGLLGRPHEAIPGLRGILLRGEDSGKCLRIGRVEFP